MQLIIVSWALGGGIKYYSIFHSIFREANHEDFLPPIQGFASHWHSQRLGQPLPGFCALWRQPWILAPASAPVRRLITQTCGRASSSHFDWPKHQLTQKHRCWDRNSLISLAPRSRWRTGMTGLEQRRSAAGGGVPATKYGATAAQKPVQNKPRAREEQELGCLFPFSRDSVRMDVTADVPAPLRKSFQH